MVQFVQASIFSGPQFVQRGGAVKGWIGLLERLLRNMHGCRVGARGRDGVVYAFAHC